MKNQNTPRTLTANWLLAAIAGFFLATISGLHAQDDYEILLRGPVHEAFAEAVSLDPEPGFIINTAPPEPIEELPPEHQLEGDNVAWIPGYWIWDDERDDFVWLSGVWRNMPPGRQWVPGYWETLPTRRYQWVAGFWNDADNEEIVYVASAPPRSLERGPNGPRPAANYNWAPGNWVYSDTRYNWRPGQWIDYRDDWTWVPARYYWTPRGYVQVDGYWDHNIDRRGVLFAPVYYRNHDHYRSPSYRYTPSIAVVLDIFLDHLFVRPRYNHYYFGDYYEPRYRDSGYYGSHSWHSHRGGYDPIFAHQRWDHRSDRDWDKKRKDRYDYYRDHQEARPLRSWSEVAAYTDKDKDHKRSFATTLDSLAKNPGKNQKFKATGKGNRDKYIEDAKEIRKYQGDRRLAESKPAAVEKDSKEAKGKPATREKIGRSPVTGRKVEDLPKGMAPPRSPDRDKDKGKPDAPKPDKAKPDAPKPDKAKPEAPKQNKSKPAAPKPEKAKPAAPKPDKAKPAASKPDKARPEAPKQDKAKPSKPEQSQPRKEEPKRSKHSSSEKSDDKDRGKKK